VLARLLVLRLLSSSSPSPAPLSLLPSLPPCAGHGMGTYTLMNHDVSLLWICCQAINLLVGQPIVRLLAKALICVSQCCACPYVIVPISALHLPTLFSLLRSHMSSHLGLHMQMCYALLLTLPAFSSTWFAFHGGSAGEALCLR
jgi:hypothetical protein